MAKKNINFLAVNNALIMSVLLAVVVVVLK